MFRTSINHYRIAMLVLRVIVGIVFLVHGYQKIEMGHAGVTGFFTQVGAPVPAVSAALIMLLETGGAIALVFGFLTRVVASAFVLEMLGAFLLVHAQHGFSAANNGYEFVLILGACAAALAIAGPGAASIDDVIARRRNPNP
jgi:putative oxidoreductase